MWPATIRVVQMVQPRCCFFENVPGLLAASHGYFGTILSDLNAAGYDARWAVISAADAGAPHLRKRLWILATKTAQPDVVKQPPFATLDDTAGAAWQVHRPSLHPARDDMVPYSEKWPTGGMMQSGKCYPLPWWPRSILVDGSGALLPSCSSSDHKGSHRLDHRKGQLTEAPVLQSQQANFPAPTTNEGGRNKSGSPGAAIRPSLGMMANRNIWPSPTASTGGPEPEGKTGRKLVTVVHEEEAAWPTPTANRRNGLQSHGKNAILGQLDADWVELLLGWPRGWSSLEPMDLERCSRWFAGFANYPYGHGRYGTVPWLDGSWEIGQPRVSRGVLHRKDRLKAIGNGQVPIAAVLAWRLLTGDDSVVLFTRPKRNKVKTTVKPTEQPKTKGLWGNRK